MIKRAPTDLPIGRRSVLPYLFPYAFPNLCFFILIDHLPQDDFFRPAANAVHCPHPRHGVAGLQLLGNALRCLHLGNHAFHPLLCLLVEIRQIRPELAGQEQVAVSGRVILSRYSLCILPHLPIGRVSSGSRRSGK